MNTKVNITGVKSLDKLAFYMQVEDAIVPMFKRMFPESLGKYAIDIDSPLKLDILHSEISKTIIDLAQKTSVTLPKDYLASLQAHFMNRIVFYNDVDILTMNSLYTVQFMSHYQLYRYLSEWVMSKLQIFKGLSYMIFGKEVLQHARTINNTLHIPINDKAVVEISVAVSKEYYSDVENQPKTKEVNYRLLVPSYEYNTVHKDHRSNGFNEEYIDWAFKSARSIRGIEFVEAEMVRNNETYHELQTAVFHMQTYLDNEYYGIDFRSRMAYKRRFALSVHMVISESIRIDSSGYLSILAPEGGYSKLKSKNLPYFLFLRCYNDQLLKSYDNPKNEVFRDMVRLKLIEFNYLRQQPLDSKLLKRHYDNALKMLTNPEEHITDRKVAFKPDPSMLNNMVSRMQKGKTK